MTVARGAINVSAVQSVQHGILGAKLAKLAMIAKRAITSRNQSQSKPKFNFKPERNMNK